MSSEKGQKEPCCCKDKQKKTATNNQWTNANVQKSRDQCERRDGPGGEGGCGYGR